MNIVMLGLMGELAGIEGNSMQSWARLKCFLNRFGGTGIMEADMRDRVNDVAEKLGYLGLEAGALVTEILAARGHEEPGTDPSAN